MSRPKKRRVKIVFEARSKQDPKAILQAVEEVLRPQETEIHVVGSPAEPTGERIVDQMANEVLETEANRRADEHLDKKNQALDQQRAQRANPAKKRTPETPAKVAETRSTFRHWLKTSAKVGWGIARIIIEYVS